MADRRNTLQGVRPSKDWTLIDGDLHIIAEDREYCIHRYFFERESLKFRALLTSPSPGQDKQGSSHLTAIKLHNATAKDFEKFLWVFYNPKYSLYDATVAEWSCILHFAYDWQFAEVVKLAIRELEKMTMSVVERIALYQQHSVSEDLLIPHYAALCTRGYPLDFAESNQLGMATVVLINQAMHAVPKSQLQSVDANSSPVDSKSSAVISKIIAHIGSEDKQAGGAADTGTPAS
ncbi:hypothetical protein B0H14DRAFT_1205417 [Mycena olivaceomarginata]|nr:hypothetical protein B0H14DRAFT_1205417 [Mycena olivaceomarginata]